MATVPTPAPKVITIPGDAIIVQMRPTPGFPTEIVFDVHRNGTRETRFSLEEFTQVLQQAQALLIQARARSLNVPKP